MRILKAMRARLLALAVAVLVALVPSHAALCEIVCADAAVAGAHEQAHSCHDPAPEPSSDATRLAQGEHVCGHGDGLPDASRVADAAPVMPLVSGPVLFAPLRIASALTEPHALPPDRRNVATPLRI